MLQKRPTLKLAQVVLGINPEAASSNSGRQAHHPPVKEEVEGLIIVLTGPYIYEMCLQYTAKSQFFLQMTASANKRRSGCNTENATLTNVCVDVLLVPIRITSNK